MKDYRNLLFGFTLLLAASACQTSDKDKKVESPKKTVVELPAPFRKHLKIEVGPELIFDIFSWGRGSDSTSSVLVLRSDSLKNDFTVASTDNLDGRLQEVFNTDMDDDGNPEVLVYYTNNDEYKTAEILCYEFTGKNVNRIRFPDLSSKTKKQYHGMDKFYVKEGKLFREFNLYEGDAQKPTGKKTVQYFLRGNSFDLKELE